MQDPHDVARVVLPQGHAGIGAFDDLTQNVLCGQGHIQHKHTVAVAHNLIHGDIVQIQNALQHGALGVDFGSPPVFAVQIDGPAQFFLCQRGGERGRCAQSTDNQTNGPDGGPRHPQPRPHNGCNGQRDGGSMLQGKGFGQNLRKNQNGKGHHDGGIQNAILRKLG